MKRPRYDEDESLSREELEESGYCFRCKQKLDECECDELERKELNFD
jgi:hypothetical protein